MIEVERQKRIFFDQSFITRASRKDGAQFLFNLNNSMLTKGNVRKSEILELLITPFTFLEAIGVNAEEIEQPNLANFSFEHENLESSLTQLYDASLSHCFEDAKLNKDKLKNKYHEQKNYQNRKLRTRIYGDLFDRFVENSNFDQQIYGALAHDFILKWIIQNNLSSTVFKSLLEDFFSHHFLMLIIALLGSLNYNFNIFNLH